MPQHGIGLAGQLTPEHRLLDAREMKRSVGEQQVRHVPSLPRGCGSLESSPYDRRVTDDVLAELEEIRASIDNIDAALVHVLAERFKYTQRVGRLKAEHDLPPADPDREARQITRLRSLAQEADLDPAFAEKFLNFIIEEVIRHHEAFRG